MSLLQVTGLTKRFGGLTAINSVEISIEPGEILGLIGPNGAGKTTLVNLLAGEIQPSAGSITYRENDITNAPSHVRCSMGIARTFQVPQPFFDLSVRENVMVGCLFGASSPVRKLDAGALSDEILDTVGLHAVRNHSTGTLTTAGLKKLEVARALAVKPTLLLLDEPLGGLNAAEATDALKLVRSIKARGIAIIFIEHIVPAVMAVSDRVLVIVNGRKLAEGSPEAILSNAEVKKSYLGDVQGSVRRRVKVPS